MSNVIQAKDMDHNFINKALRYTEDCVIEGCCGQRFIAAGMKDKNIEIHGVPGTAPGAYLNVGTLTVMGNAQDAVGDTMNDGTIIVHGNIGDAAGYAMRGGKIYVKGNAGYRAGIHMKAYKEKVPVMVIGGKAGSFLGEYQAGGIIVVLNMLHPGDKIVGFFPCTGMHGGKMFLRSDFTDVVFPAQGDALFHGLDAGIGLDAAELGDGITALVQDVHDLVIQTDLFDGAAAVGQKHPRTEGAQRLIKMRDGALSEIDPGRNVMSIVQHGSILLFICVKMFCCPTTKNMTTL